MAHSYVQAGDTELDAFRSFVRSHPQTILLVDTYDTEEGVRNVVRLARELGADFQVQGVRIDSGDLVELSFRARRILDAAGLHAVQIFVSGGLDEHDVARIIDAEAPVDGFGVGTALGVSADAPAIDMAYKLTAYGGEGRVKTSPGKPILPGRKQVFRCEEQGWDARDVITRANEAVPEGRPLLVPVMEQGRRLAAAHVSLDEARRHAADQLARLPPHIRAIQPEGPPFSVEISAALRAYAEKTVGAVAPPTAVR